MRRYISTENWLAETESEPPALNLEWAARGFNRDRADIYLRSAPSDNPSRVREGIVALCFVSVAACAAASRPRPCHVRVSV
jgi:hypothetical protein